MTLVVSARGSSLQVSKGASSRGAGSVHQQGPLLADVCGPCQLESHTVRRLSAWGPTSGHRQLKLQRTLSVDPAAQAQHWRSHLCRWPRNKGAMLSSERAFSDLVILEGRDSKTGTAGRRIRQPPAGHPASHPPIVSAQHSMHRANATAGDFSQRSKVPPTIIPLSGKTLSKVLPYSGGHNDVFSELTPVHITPAADLKSVPLPPPLQASKRLFTACSASVASSCLLTASTAP